MSGSSVCSNAPCRRRGGRRKYVRFISMYLCILDGGGMRADRRKYARFIGMNVCPVELATGSRA